MVKSSLCPSRILKRQAGASWSSSACRGNRRKAEAASPTLACSSTSPSMRCPAAASFSFSMTKRYPSTLPLRLCVCVCVFFPCLFCGDFFGLVLRLGWRFCLFYLFFPFFPASLFFLSQNQICWASYYLVPWIQSMLHFPPFLPWIQITPQASDQRWKFTTGVSFNASWKW